MVPSWDTFTGTKVDASRSLKKNVNGVRDFGSFYPTEDEDTQIFTPILTAEAQEDFIPAFRTFDQHTGTTTTYAENEVFFNTVCQKWKELGKSLERPSLAIGIFELEVAEASNLPAADFAAYLDPYCVATLTGYWSHGQEWPPEMRSSFRTQGWTQTMNPAWQEHHAFPVPRSGGAMRIEVFDWNATTESELVGYVEVPLEAFLSGRRTEAWLRLKISQRFYEISKNIHKSKVKIGEEAAADLLAEKVAAVRVVAQYHVVPWAEAASKFSWPEDPKRQAVIPFNLKRTLFEVFKLLTLIQPIIHFFNAPDGTGVLDLWKWQRPLKSLGWCMFLGWLCGFYPNAVFPFLQAFLVLVSYQKRSARRAQMIRFRLETQIREHLKLKPDKPIPESIAIEAGFSVGSKEHAQLQAVNLEAGSSVDGHVGLLPSDIRKLRKDVEKEVDHSMSVGPPKPNFYARPEGLSEDQVYDAREPMFYFDNLAQDRYANFIPEDNYEECATKVQLGVVTKRLVDDLIDLIRANWMDKTENMLIKVNNILDAVSSLFDWRQPLKCRNVAIFLSLSAALQLAVVPFSRFLVAINFAIFVVLTPLPSAILRALTVPSKVRNRAGFVETLRNKPREMLTSSALVNLKGVGDKNQQAYHEPTHEDIRGVLLRRTQMREIQERKESEAKILREYSSSPTRILTEAFGSFRFTDA